MKTKKAAPQKATKVVVADKGYFVTETAGTYNHCYNMGVDFVKGKNKGVDSPLVPKYNEKC